MGRRAAPGLLGRPDAGRLVADDRFLDDVFALGARSPRSSARGVVVRPRGRVHGVSKPRVLHLGEGSFHALGHGDRESQRAPRVLDALPPTVASFCAWCGVAPPPRRPAVASPRAVVALPTSTAISTFSTVRSSPGATVNQVNSAWATRRRRRRRSRLDRLVNREGGARELRPTPPSR